LRPLFDRVFERGIFSSTDGKQDRSGYGAQKGTGVRLETIGSKTPRRTKKHGKTDVSGTTLGQDSQESILSFHGQSDDRGENHMLDWSHGILRTHQFTVESKAASDQS
jgi:hypothetical protein